MKVIATGGDNVIVTMTKYELAGLAGFTQTELEAATRDHGNRGKLRCWEPGFEVPVSALWRGIEQYRSGAAQLRRLAGDLQAEASFIGEAAATLEALGKLSAQTAKEPI